jgi:hypothetical protein
MPVYKMRLELSRSGAEHPIYVVEETADRDREAEPEGEENLGIELAAEFQKAMRFYEHFAAIPNVDCDLVEPRSRRIDFSQWWDVRNTESLWLEISNTLKEVRFLLGQARSYKTLEPSKDQPGRRAEQLKYYAHFSKMHHFNLAVFGIVKIQDLVVRLLFENFGGDLIDVDQTDDEWERGLTLSKVRIGLKEHLSRGELSVEEYEEITAALEWPSKSQHQDVVVSYRNRLVHRIRPSVDYPELFTELEDRVGKPILDGSGKEKGRKFAIRGRPSDEPDFLFVDLYSTLLDYLKHVIEMLVRLKRVPRLT